MKIKATENGFKITNNAGTKDIVKSCAEAVEAKECEQVIHFKSEDGLWGAAFGNHVIVPATLEKPVEVTETGNHAIIETPAATVVANRNTNTSITVEGTYRAYENIDYPNIITLQECGQEEEKLQNPTLDDAKIVTFCFPHQKPPVNLNELLKADEVTVTKLGFLSDKPLYVIYTTGKEPSSPIRATIVDGNGEVVEPFETESPGELHAGLTEKVAEKERKEQEEYHPAPK